MNLTPMIDCTFQLIIFFILVSQMTSDQLVPLIVPSPEKPQTLVDDDRELQPGVAVVNIWSRYKGEEKLADGTKRIEDPLGTILAEGYKVQHETIEPGNIQRLAEILREKRLRHKSLHGDRLPFYVEIRADRDLGYEQILPVMRAAAHAHVDKMYMTAITSTTRS